MRNTSFFNQAACTVIIDGEIAEQFLDGDSVRITQSAEGSTVDRGFDGATTTFSTDRTGTLEIDLKGTSPTLDLINDLWSAQKTANAREFSCQIMTTAAEPIYLDGCSIASPGNIATGGRQASARTVVINVRTIVAS